MKKILFLFLGGTTLLMAQANPSKTVTSNYFIASNSLNQEGALALLFRANSLAKGSDKKIAVAVLDSAGNIILLASGDGVGPHNVKAAQRKAFTALSTKTASLQLSRNVAANPDATHLSTISELLLLGGGIPIVINNNIVGSIGIAGGGGPEQDDLLAKQTISVLNN